MNQIIVLNIDVTQVEKSRLKTITRKNGKEAKFLELVLIETPNGQYGDYMVKQQVTKEERAAKKEMPILGNGKIIGGCKSARETPAVAAMDDSPPPF